MKIKNWLNRFSLNQKNRIKFERRNNLSVLLFLLITGLLAGIPSNKILAQDDTTLSTEAKTQETTQTSSVSKETNPQQPTQLAADKDADVIETAKTAEIASKDDAQQSVVESTASFSNLNPSEQNRLQKALQDNPWIFLHPYVATYDISAEGDKLGHAYRRMSSTSGVWNVEMSTKLKKWFITFKSQEYSNFIIQDNKLKTLEFYSGTKLSFKKDRVIQQKFDWNSKQETGNKDNQGWTLPFEEPLFDRMSHLVQLRADLLLNRTEFNYPISYKGKHLIYSYTLGQPEKITTQFGDFNTVKLIRTSGDDSSFSIWLSPELNYFPIKIAQYEQDKPDVELLLSKLEFITPDQLIGK